MPVPPGPGREAVGTFWVNALPPDVIYGRAGIVRFPTSPALPSSHSSLGSKSRQICPRKHTGPCRSPLVSGEMAAQSGGKWWSAKCRNQNYTKGKTGRAQEIKMARKGFAFYTHIVLLSFSQEIIPSSRAQCQMSLGVLAEA